MLDHIGSPNPLVRGAQRLLDPLVAVRLQGDQLLRDPTAAVVFDNHLRITEYSLRRGGIVLRLTARATYAARP